MTKHYLEAFIGRITGFRVICEDPEQCKLDQDYEPGCIFQDHFDHFGLDIIAWPMNEREITLGRIELKAEIEGPIDEPEARLMKRDEDNGGTGSLPPVSSR